jgi:hypothetical protein
MSNKSAFKKFFKDTPVKPKPITPRDVKAINEQYTQLCSSLGDRYVKREGANKEIEQIMRAMEQLGNELSERNKLDAAEKAKQVESSKSNDAGIPVSGAV